MSKQIQLFLITILIPILVFYFSCYVLSTKVQRLIPTPQTNRILSPTKAHLIDGSLIIFRNGFNIGRDGISGTGLFYNPTRKYIRTVDGITMDSVAFLEYYHAQADAKTILGGLLGPTVFLGGITNEKIKKAIFGSCPTIYSHDGENYSLKAECFSYSICPATEASDLDRIDGDISSENEFELKIKNEALETHYINQLQLCYVDHQSIYEAYPTIDQDVILFGPNNLVTLVQDKMDNEITSLVSKIDTNWFRTDSSVLAQLTYKKVEDWIEVHFKKPEKTKKIVLALCIRNTLLNTILFYEVMLRSAGIHSLDWMAGEGLHPFYGWHFRKWYIDNFGLKIQIWNGQKFETIKWIGDCGPIAWRQVAISLNLNCDEENAKIRLVFLPDNWMFDWVGVSAIVEEKSIIHSLNCQVLKKIENNDINVSPDPIINADNEYLVTYPAEAYHAIFQVPKQKDNLNRTYFLKSKGYYIEWLRQEWFIPYNEDSLVQELKMDDETITKTARLWKSKKNDFEKDFFSSKISKSR